MNIALIGHGTMGKEVEALAHKRNITVKQIFALEKIRTPPVGIEHHSCSLWNGQAGKSASHTSKQE